MAIQVKKRNGHLEDMNLEKMHKVVFWATRGLENVSASEVEIRSQIQFYEGITTSDIQETMIKSAADLISEETLNQLSPTKTCLQQLQPMFTSRTGSKECGIQILRQRSIGGILRTRMVTSRFSNKT
jgi:hypothetical protein